MKTSIIICTYNEAKTLAGVVKSCCECNPDAEVIVVDDGSTDATPSIMQSLVETYSFRYERLPENKGKSWAMVHGVEISSNEIILFFDADVSHIKAEHFMSLLKPILENKADMVLGQPSETLIDYRVNPFKALTGERALWKKDILSILEDIRTIRFGVETFINLYYQAKGKKIKYVLLEGLLHPTKYQKTTPLKATKEFLKEGTEIAMALFKNHDLINQRIELLFDKTNQRALQKLNLLQQEINKTLSELKKKIDL